MPFLSFKDRHQPICNTFIVNHRGGSQFKILGALVGGAMVFSVTDMNKLKVENILESS